MKIRFSTLQQWLPDLEQSPQEVAELLTRRSFEVEDINYLGEQWNDLVVGLVEEVEPHPNADRLRIAHVDVGEEETRRIVCGADNLAVNQHVPVALPGATLPDGTAITTSTIRQEESHGMICSKTELELDDSGSGVMILPSDNPAGTPLARALGEDDWELEIDTTALGPRASDAFSVYGVAREISLLMGLELQLPQTELPEETGNIRTSRDETICGRYMTLEAEGVGHLVGLPSHDMDTVHAHPLVALGNYVMEEFGQPLHVFDADKLVGSQITVRQAQNGEKFTTLGGQEVALQDGDIVICDEENIIALGGVIGGEIAKVDEETKRIVVESAHFDPRHIRRTARRLHQLTDASKRFEKGLPVELTEMGLGRFAHYLQQMEQLVIQEGDATDQDQYEWHLEERRLSLTGVTDDGKTTTEHAPISLSPTYVASYVGEQLTSDTVSQYLEQIGCHVTEEESQSFFTRVWGMSFLGGESHEEIEEHPLNVSPPWYRLDLTTSEELIEEVARLYGYENITPDTSFAAQMAERDPFYEWCKGLRYSLKGLGYDEIHTYPYAEDGEVKLANPVREETPFMRSSLREGMRYAAENNTSYGARVKLFEIATVFYTGGEKTHLSLYMAPQTDNEGRHLQCLRAGVLHILEEIDIAPLTVTQPEPRVVKWWYGGTEIGVYQVADHILEIDLTTLYEVARFSDHQFTSLPDYPAVKRDITLSVFSDVPSEYLYQLLREYRNELCERITFADVYETESYKNVTFHLEYRAPDRSLTDDEVNEYVEYLVARVQSEVDAGWV
jgi:phenylalanyl-tRNA synthetase beta chain